MQTIYSFWLPIENFDEIKENCEKCYEGIKSGKNNHWEWIVLAYDHFNITIDSLGFFYIQCPDNTTTGDDEKRKKKIIEELEKHIDKQTKELIKHTFIHS